MSELRDPDQVMRLVRMGASHPTRLSFMRVLLRGLRRGGWRRSTAPNGPWTRRASATRSTARAGQGQTYSLVAFAHDLPDHLRSDRVIAEAWDATFALMDGDAEAADIERLAANVPRQEAGRVSDRELVLSRANRSGRLWEHVVDRLAQGQQPDPARIDEVGYLMRTTAVYGSGKFGAADHNAMAGRPLMDGPFRAEMLAVWLIRAFVADLVEHMAACGAAKRPCGSPRSAPRAWHRQRHRPRHGALPRQSPRSPEQLDHRARNGDRPRPRPASGTAAQRDGFAAALARAQVAAAGWRSSDPVQSAAWDALRRRSRAPGRSRRDGRRSMGSGRGTR
jgi:hypothetical protein